MTKRSEPQVDEDGYILAEVADPLGPDNFPKHYAGTAEDRARLECKCTCHIAKRLGVRVLCLSCFCP